MNKLVFLFAIIISFLLCFFSSSIFFIVILCIIIIVFSFLYKRFDILSPLIWFAPFILVYHFSAVFSHYNNVINIHSPLEVIKTTAYAFHSYIFFSVLFLKIRNNNNRFKESFFIKKPHEKLLNIILYVLLLLSLFFSFQYMLSGISSKSEAAAIGVSGGLADYVNRILILLLSLKFFNNEQNNVPYFKQLLFFLLYFLILIFITGERDFLFIYMIQILFIKFYHNKISLNKIIIIVITALFLIPILGEMKNLFSLSSINAHSGSNNLNIFERLFYTGEFISGGRNLDTVITYNYMMNEKITYINDIIRSIIPSDLIYRQNTLSLFAQTFHYERFSEGQGLGFSLIAEGYVNGDNLGVIILFAILGFLYSIFFNKRTNNMFYYVAFIYFIPLAIYALRGDLSTILSPIIKQVLIPLLLIRKVFYEKK